MAGDVVKINRIEDFYTLDPGRDYVAVSPDLGAKRPRVVIGSREALVAVHRDVAPITEVRPYTGRNR